MGLVPLKKGPREHSSPLSTLRTSEVGGLQPGREFSPEPNQVGTLLSDLQPPEWRGERNKCLLLLSHPVALLHSWD